MEEFLGIEKLLLIIFFLLKKNFTTTSCVTNIAIKPNKGLIPSFKLIDFFPKLIYYIINNLSACNFILAIIGRLQDCLETRIFKL